MPFKFKKPKVLKIHTEQSDKKLCLNGRYPGIVQWSNRRKDTGLQIKIPVGMIVFEVGIEEKVKSQINQEDQMKIGSYLRE